jgi:purine-nucleoside phosphorylase
VLGSGLGSFLDALEMPESLGFGEIPHWRPVHVAGHQGRLVVGLVRGRRVAAVAGRTHFYEGGEAVAATFAVRVLGLLGVKVLILTNASGGIDPELSVGTIVVIDDHLNLTGHNPLTRGHDERYGTRFVEMTDAYAPRLRAVADAASVALGPSIAHGVYAGVSGPSYETPAEIRALRALGADLVGMSTVHEAIVARQMGMEVLALSLVTNRAAGLAAGALHHGAVLEASARGGPQLAALLEEIIGRL